MIVTISNSLLYNNARAADCGGTYAQTIATRKEELLNVYAQSIEKGNNKEVMTSINSCVRQVEEIFKNRVKNPLNGLTDVYSIVKALSEKLANRLCDGVIGQLRNEIHEWESLWSQIEYLGKTNTTDWSLLRTQTLQCNRTISSVLTDRLKELLK